MQAVCTGNLSHAAAQQRNEVLVRCAAAWEVFNPLLAPRQVQAPDRAVGAIRTPRNAPHK